MTQTPAEKFALIRETIGRGSMVAKVVKKGGDSNGES